MNLLRDVHLEQWQIDKIMPKFYNELQNLTYRENGTGGYESFSISSIIICHALQNSILNYIAEFATECAREL